jgi:glyoxylase-like metal-dependent hydrolase (beta-lactamase superfamily II)
MHVERMAVRDGSLRPVPFPATVAVIQHPKRGVVLFDTGYSEWFFRATAPFPERLYRWMTPVHLGPEQTARAQLAALGVAPGDVRTIVISHFHADHIAGLRDFPRAELVFAHDAYESVRARTRWNALRCGVMPALLPEDFAARARPLEAVQFVAATGLPAPFARGADVLGDGSLLAVELPGHATGQIGLSFEDAASGRAYLLVADAAWSTRAIVEGVLPHPIAMRGILNSDARAYAGTLAALGRVQRANPRLRVLPCHASDALQAAPLAHVPADRALSTAR